MADALRSVAMADAELIQLKARDGASSVWMTERLQNRKVAIIQAEGAQNYSGSSNQSRPITKSNYIITNQQIRHLGYGNSNAQSRS